MHGITDGSTLQGIAAIIGACVAAIGALSVAIRGQTWMHAFRANLDLVAERDAFAAMNKRLTVETMATLAAAQGWESSFHSIEATQKDMKDQLAETRKQLIDTRRQLTASTLYIHDLMQHVVGIEQRIRGAGVPFADLQLPPPPPDLGSPDGSVL